MKAASGGHSNDRFSMPGGMRAALWVSFATFLLWPLLSHVNQIGNWHDWTYFAMHGETTRQTLAEYMQLPQWNPWYCGGITAIGNVQSDAGSPFQLLNVIFGSMIGAKLTWVCFIAIGMEGGFRYARELGNTELAATVAAVVYACCGRVIQLFIDGHTAFIGFLLLPWLVLCLDRGTKDWRWSIAGGLFMSLVFMQGGAVPTPMLAVFLGFYAVLRALESAYDAREVRAAFAPLISLALMGLVTVGTSAVRLLPFAETLIKYPRHTVMIQNHPFGEVAAMLFEHRIDGGYHGGGTAFVGLATLLLALIALTTRKRAVAFLGVLFLITWNLTSGQGGGFRLYEILKMLPVFEDIRNPFRYAFMLAFLAAQLAAFGATAVQRSIVELAQNDRTRRALQILAALLVLIPIAEVVPYQQDRLAQMLNLKEVSAIAKDDEFRQAMGNRWNSHVWPFLNRGTLSCFEEQPFPQSGQLRGDLTKEEYFGPMAAGSVERISWSPHQIRLAVRLEQPERLFVNQNFNDAWQSSHGDVVPYDGLLAIDLPAGEYELQIRFRDRLIQAGFAISIASWLAILAALIWSWRARRRATRAASDDLMRS